MPAPPTLTSEQIAKAAERRAAKLAKKAALVDGHAEPSPEQKAELERRRFLQRPWITLGQSGGEQYNVRIITWNILAQTLVRRELFPGSDCLKWGDRRPMLQAELEHHNTNDIICLQECDRLDSFLPSLPKHSHIKASGPGKLHGLVILYRTDRFALRASKTVYLDDEALSTSAGTEGTEDDRRRRGGSRQTKNIGLIVALQDRENENRGIVAATTHLFWHPKYGYERVRQSIILMRNIRQFQHDNDCSNWPAVFAGDLNTQPSEATYQLLVAPHRPLPLSFLQDINESRFVHDSVSKIAPAHPSSSETPSTSGTGSNTPSITQFTAKDEGNDEDGEGEGELPDSNEKSLANTRSPRYEDGILLTDELVQAMKEIVPDGGRSAYGSVDWAAEQGEIASETFVQRNGFGEKGDAEGGNEPAYTCFTPLFRLTLDYLLLLPSTDNGPIANITALLAPPRLEQLEEGLPRKGICASDHLAVGCELSW